MTVAEFIEQYCSDVDFYRLMRQLQHVWAEKISSTAATAAIEERLQLNKAQLQTAVTIIQEQIEY